MGQTDRVVSAIARNIGAGVILHTADVELGANAVGSILCLNGWKEEGKKALVIWIFRSFNALKALCVVLTKNE